MTPDSITTPDDTTTSDSTARTPETPNGAGIPKPDASHALRVASTPAFPGGSQEAERQIEPRIARMEAEMDAARKRASSASCACATKPGWKRR